MGMPQIVKAQPCGPSVGQVALELSGFLGRPPCGICTVMPGAACRCMGLREVRLGLANRRTRPLCDLSVDRGR